MSESDNNSSNSSNASNSNTSSNDASCEGCTTTTNNDHVTPGKGFAAECNECMTASHCYENYGQAAAKLNSHREREHKGDMSVSMDIYSNCDL